MAELINIGAAPAFDPAGVVTAIINFLLIIVVVGIVIFMFLWIWRITRWNIDVEIFERKGNQVFFHSDDKGRRDSRREGDFIMFMKNKAEPFKFKPWPSSEYVMRKKWFGSKAKAVLSDGALNWWIPQWSDNPGMYVQPMPVNQRIEYVQRQKLIAQRYNPNPNKYIVYTTIAFGLLAMTMVILGFFQWQIIESSILQFNGNVDQFASIVREATQARELAQQP